MNILHVTHSWSGGIDTYIHDLTDATCSGQNNFILKSIGDKLEISYNENGDVKKNTYYLNKRIQLSSFYDREYARIIFFILKSFNIQTVHISSTVYHTFDIFRVPKRLGIPVIFTVHDFFHICPTIHLVGKDGNFCGICRHGEEQKHCLNAHPYVYSKFDAHQLKLWRNEFFKIKKHIDLFIFPSYSAKSIFSNFYQLDPSICRVIGHGISHNGDAGPRCHDSLPGLRVGIVGTMQKHKGSKLYIKVVNTIDDRDIKFIHFGDGRISARKLKRYGRYQRKDIVSLLQSHQIDVVMLLSTWPETFSYTLSESLAAGKPVIVTNFGALKERVEKADIGWVIPDNRPQSICTLLTRLKNDKKQLQQKSQCIRSLHLKTLSEMRNEYHMMYQAAITERNPFFSVNKHAWGYRYSIEKFIGKRKLSFSHVFSILDQFMHKMARSISYFIY